MSGIDAVEGHDVGRRLPNQARQQCLALRPPHGLCKRRRRDRDPGTDLCRARNERYDTTVAAVQRDQASRVERDTGSRAARRFRRLGIPRTSSAQARSSLDSAPPVP